MADNSLQSIWNNLQAMAQEIQDLKAELRALQERKIQLMQTLSEYERASNEENDYSAQISQIQDMIMDINDEIYETESEINSIESNASSISATCREESIKNAQKSSSHQAAADTFSRLSKGRFGAKTASAGGAAASQHSDHYSSLAKEYGKLAQAAETVAYGGSISGQAGHVEAYGEFRDPGTATSSGSNQRQSGTSTKQEQSPNSGRTTWGGRTSGRGSDHEITDAIIMNTSPNGIVETEGVPDLTPVSNGEANGDFSIGNSDYAADYHYAKKYGMTPSEVREYREENGFVWRMNKDGSEAILIPESINNCYEKPDEEKTDFERLQEYMNKHNYGKANYAEYSKDPEWQRLHHKAFPGYEENLQGLIEDGALACDFTYLTSYLDYNRPPQAVADDVFERFTQETGIVCSRIFRGKEGVATPEQARDAFCYEGDKYIYNHGYMADGKGIYAGANKYPVPGKKVGLEEIKQMDQEIIGAADNPDQYVIEHFTVSPDFKFGDGAKLQKEFDALDPEIKEIYMSSKRDYHMVAKRHGLAEYAIAKGYDGLLWPEHGRNTQHVTIYNRGKLIIKAGLYNISI